jgi:hypothetical protein
LKKIDEMKDEDVNIDEIWSRLPYIN